MKFTSTLLLCCSFLCLTTVNAQFDYDLEELLERHSQTYMGSLNDVFTTGELQVLQVHFNELNDPNTSSTSSILTRRGESTKGNTPVSVVQFDPETIGLNTIGGSPLSEFEGAGFVFINPGQGSGIIDNTNRIHLRGLGSTTYVDQGQIDISAIPAGVLTGIEVLSNGDVYGIATNGVDDSRLVQIDPSNWTAMMIGGNNGLIVPINLMRDGDDNLYTLDIDSDAVYGMDKTTGAATFIGDCGFDANFGQGGCYDATVDKILLTAYNTTLGDSELRELNPVTGMTMSLGTITPGVQDQFGWVGWYDEDTVGVNSNSFEGFSYYPNPVENELRLSAQTTIDRVTVYNVLGQEIVKKEIQQLEGTLNLEHHLSGYYLLKVEIDGNTETFKLIKQ